MKTEPRTLMEAIRYFSDLDGSPKLASEPALA
jgi:hypothetical protein